MCIVWVYTVLCLFVYSELVKCMLEQEHVSGEALQAFDKINKDSFESQDNGRCCISAV